MNETKSPLVSVLLASYNQERYLRSAIECVLMQSFTDFELLISDDASSDDSRKIIETYKDARIRTHFFNENQGSVLNTRYLCSHARGKYIAFIGSDDLWLQGKLEKQVACMEADPDIGVCFTWANTVDENGTVLTKEQVSYSEIFLQHNQSRGKWLRKFFYEGNCVAHPSAMIRADAYRSVAPHSVALRQIPDFDLWIRLAKRYDFFVVNEILTQNRMMIQSAGNISAVTSSTIIRNMNESMLIIETFFDDMDDDVFIDGFGDLFRKKQGPWTHTELECEKAFLLCKGNYLKLASQIEGFSCLRTLLDDDESRATLEETYQFRDRDFFTMTGSDGLGAYICAKEHPAEMSNNDAGNIRGFLKRVAKVFGRKT